MKFSIQVRWTRMHLLILSACLLAMASCTSKARTSFDTVFTHVHIVDVANNRILKDQMVGILNGQVTMVQKMDEDSLKGFEIGTLFNGNNGYLMPALWDNHVHFRGGDSLTDVNRKLMKHFLSHGITAVRDAGGDLASSVLQWRDAVKGTPDTPYPLIYTCGPKLDGAEPAWPGSIKVTDTSLIASALDSLVRLKVDYVKLYDGSMTPDVWYGLIRGSQQRGLKVTGHMPMGASITKGIAHGLDGSEHMHYLTKACSPLEDSLTEEQLGYAMLPYIADSYDETLAQGRFQLLAEKRVYVCPTLFISKTLAELADADHASDSMLTLMDPALVSTYAMRIESAKRAKERGNNRRGRMLELSMRMIRPMYDAGVPILAGSDCGAFNSYVYPGESLHNELFLLVEAGLKPYEALSCSVINGPAFFNQQDRFGSVAPGKQADLVLLRSNPLSDIRAISELQAVHLRNRLYSANELPQFD